MSQKNFLVLGVSDCKFCDKAQELAEDRAKVIYVQVAREELKKNGFQTAPVVFEYIGGYQEMLASVLRSENE